MHDHIANYLADLITQEKTDTNSIARKSDQNYTGPIF